MKGTTTMRLSKTNFKDLPPVGKYVVVGSTVFILIAVGLLFYFGFRETSVTVSNGSVRIAGMYGQTIDLDNIERLSLYQSSLVDMGASFRRTNGVGGFGQRLLGNFTSPEFGQVMLYVQSQTSPTIYIKLFEGKDVFISFLDGDKTVQLLEEIENAFY